MKKLLFGLALLFSISLMAVSCSSDDNDNNLVLPQTASSFLTAKFKGAKVLKVSRVNDNTKKEYEVILDNGIKVEFDQNGNWVEIEAIDDKQAIPSEFVPEKILAFLTEKYPNSKVNSIELEDNGGYEIELTDGTDLEFDKNGNLIEIDK